MSWWGVTPTKSCGTFELGTHKCVGAVKGASKEKVRKIAGVERVSTYLNGMQVRFVARTAREKYLCGMLWEGGLQRAPRIAGTHGEFHTMMDYADGIRNCPRGPVWILSDSKAVMAAVVNAGRTCRASTGSLANAVA